MPPGTPEHRLDSGNKNSRAVLARLGIRHRPLCSPRRRRARGTRPPVTPIRALQSFGRVTAPGPKGDTLSFGMRISRSLSHDSRSKQILGECLGLTLNGPEQLSSEWLGICGPGCGGQNYCDTNSQGNRVPTTVNIWAVSGNATDAVDQHARCIPIYLGTCVYDDVGPPGSPPQGTPTTLPATNGRTVCCSLTLGTPNLLLGCPCLPDPPPQQ